MLVDIQLIAPVAGGEGKCVVAALVQVVCVKNPVAAGNLKLYFGGSAGVLDHDIAL